MESFFDLKRKISNELIKKFKEKRKVTCCSALSAPYKHNPIEHKQNCTSIVQESAQILEELVSRIS